MNKDTIVGIVGAVVLVAAMVGVFKYEGSQAQASLGSKSFDVAWSAATLNGPTAEETTALGASTEVPMEITAANLTQAKFTFTWTAQAGQDTLAVTVTPPEGSGIEPQTQESASGTITLTFDVPNEVPAGTTVFGNSEDDARARLAAEHTKTLGTGEWLVKVEFTEATGVVPVPGIPPVQPDEEVTWTAKTQLTQYVPGLTPK